MARAQAERDIAEQVHDLLWDSSGDAAEAAKGGGHQQQRIKELEELLAELKRCLPAGCALRTKHSECVLAACFPSGTALEDVGKMVHAQFSAVVDQSRNRLVALLAELGAQLATVGSAQQAAEGGKFASELRGGTLENFYQGVPGLCGEPDADIEAGSSRASCQRRAHA